MRYVVTGAAGFIGSHLTDALLADGHEVVAVDGFTAYYDPALKEANAAGFPVERVDLASVGLDLSGVDGVFHLAGRPGARGGADVFPDYLRDNVLASQLVFGAAAAAGVRVVFASSSSVYGDASCYPTPESAATEPRSLYGLTKLSCEHLLDVYGRESGLDAVALRYFTVYGPRQRPDMFFARVVESLAGGGGAVAVYGDGEQSRGFTYVADAVNATIAAMTGAPTGSLYNVGGGEEATLNEAIAILEHVASGRVEVARSPRAHGDVSKTQADTSRIRSELGWEPAVSLEEGLRAQWESILRPE